MKTPTEPRPVVLIVEDDRFNVRLLTEACRSAGMDVRVVMDGLDAVDEALRSPPDLILLDLMLPRLNGFGVLERVRADPRGADVPVILVSAVQDVSARAQAVELGADDFVPKPFRLPELRERMQAVLAQRALMRDMTPYPDKD
mgnify:CR=1 FL=1